MNTKFLEVLQEVLLGLLITKPNMERGEQDQRKKTQNQEDSEPEWIYALWVPSRVLFEREREKQNISQPK